MTNGRFTTISCHFFAIHIFYKTEVQTVILRCLTCLNLNWFKNYDSKCKFDSFDAESSSLKEVFSKRSGNCIVAPNFCLFSQRLQILGTCLFFNFAELCKISVRLDYIDTRHFIRVPPLMFFYFLIYQKFKGGDPYKMSNINDVQSF